MAPPSVAPAAGRASRSISTVAGSTRPSMKPRNGAITGAKASSGCISPATIGSIPSRQASVKTGSITK